MPAKTRIYKNAFLLRIDADKRVLISIVIAAIALAIAWPGKTFSAPGLILVTWTAFALSIIFFDWLAILLSHPREVRRIARLQDSSRLMIFVFVITSSIVCMIAIYLLLKSAAGQVNADRSVLLAMGAVVITWWLVHTVFAMRYAHLYYDTSTDSGKQLPCGGLEFPGDDKEPDYMDFVYFSFVLGMTFQVSDIEISSKRIRRLAWGHGLISFAFNTAIVALGINIISGLISK